MIFLSGYLCSHPSPFPTGSPSEPSDTKIAHSGLLPSLSLVLGLLTFSPLVPSTNEPSVNHLSSFQKLQTSLFNCDLIFYSKGQELSCREISPRSISLWLHVSLWFSKGNTHVSTHTYIYTHQSQFCKAIHWGYKELLHMYVVRLTGLLKSLSRLTLQSKFICNPAKC